MSQIGGNQTNSAQMPIPNSPPIRPAAKSVHIDTSLQIERWKRDQRSNAVRVALGQYPFTSTSSYARKEFKRAWLQDLALVYKKAKGCSTIGEVYTAVDKATSHRMARRRRQRCIQVLESIVASIANQPMTAVAVLRTCAVEIILGAFTEWERSITHEYDGTRCVRATERPSRGSDGTIDVVVRECKVNQSCAMKEFFLANAEAFRRVLQHIRHMHGPSEELQASARVICAGLEDPADVCGSDKCSDLSDAIIAIDGLAAEHYAANNDKEWVPLSEALGKPLINPLREPAGSG